MMILFITTVILKTTRETQSLHLSVKFNIHIYKVELVTVEKTDRLFLSMLANQQ